MGQELAKILESEDEREKRILEHYRKSTGSRDLYFVAKSLKEKLSNASITLGKYEKWKEYYDSQISILNKKILEDNENQINERNAFHNKIRNLEYTATQTSRRSKTAEDLSSSLRTELDQANEKILNFEQIYVPELSRLNGACAEKNEFIKQLDDKVRMLTKEKEEAKFVSQKLALANLKLEKSEKNKDTYCTQISSLNTACMKKNETIKELENKISDFITETNRKHDAEINTLQNKIQLLTKDLGVSNDRVSQLSSELEIANKALSEEKESATDSKQESNDLVWERRLFDALQKLKIANCQIQYYKNLTVIPTSDVSTSDEKTTKTQNYLTQISNLTAACKRKNEEIKDLKTKVAEWSKVIDDKDSISLSKGSNSKSQSSIVVEESEISPRKLNDLKNLSCTENALNTESSTVDVNNFNENWSIQEKQLLTEIVNKSEAIKELGSRIFELSEELKMRDLDDNGKKVEISCLKLKYEKKCEELEMKEDDLWECKHKIAKLGIKLDKRRRVIETCDRK